jgi:hypothetical protein
MKTKLKMCYFENYIQATNELLKNICYQKFQGISWK